MAMQRVRGATEITQTLPLRDRVDPGVGPEGKGAFRQALMDVLHAGHFNERIDRALTQIDELGARLAESLSMADLKQYRQVFATLFRDLQQQMVQVRTQMEWDSQAWEHRTLITIRKVDAELEKLSEMLLSQEQDRLSILDKMGEIRGMLLDVRM